MTPVVVTTPCTSCIGDDLRGLERTRFFSRQIVTPEDLTQDQIYFREKAKRHNRMLHGWGVVCGACVRRGTGDCEVLIEPGYVIGPFGDEIVIENETKVDICKLGLGEQDGCCDDDLDPWCAEPRGNCNEGTLFLAIRYSECRSRPVRGGGGCGCGCDEGDCEYSRIRDSYTLKLLRDLPAGYTTPMKQPPFSSVNPYLRPNTARGCPPCPTDPWVILADIAITADCKVRSINCFTHRRYVMSFADFFFTMASGGTTTTPGSIGSTGAALGVTDAMKMMGLMSGTMSLVDTTGAMTGQPPRAMVALTRADGSATLLPAYFSVQSGTTVADLLEREGDRVFFDPADNRTYTLRDIYPSVGVPATTRLTGTASALSALEGKTLRGASVAPVPTRLTPDTGPAPTSQLRERLRQSIDPSALETIETMDDAAELPATAIAGVSETSALGKRVANLSVADVGAMTLDEFVAHALEGASARRRKDIALQAEAVWKRAQNVTSAYAPEPEEPND